MESRRHLMAVWAVVLLVCGALCGACARAGAGPEPAETGATPAGANPTPSLALMKLTQRLDLTDAQQEALAPLLAERRRQTMPLIEQYREGGFFEKRRARRSLFKVSKKSNKAIKDVLTKEQAKAFDALRKEVRKQLRETMRQRKKAASDAGAQGEEQS